MKTFEQWTIYRWSQKKREHIRTHHHLAGHMTRKEAQDLWQRQCTFNDNTLVVRERITIEILILPD